MSVRGRIVIDLIFYLGLPLLIWNFGRNWVGDYLAMFSSAGCGIGYTAWRFSRDRRYNATGLIIVGGITLNLFLNIISDSALGILYNSLILNGTLVTLYSVSLIVRRPLGRVFYIDYRRMHGEDPHASAAKAALMEKRIYFDYLTALFVIREGTMLSVKWLMLRNLGVEGAGVVILVNRLVSYTFIGMIALMIFAIDRQWKSDETQQEGGAL